MLDFESFPGVFLGDRTQFEIVVTLKDGWSFHHYFLGTCYCKGAGGTGGEGGGKQTILEELKVKET